MNIPEAIKITGGLTNTSKMPCYSYGIPAYTCKVGGQLRREVENSVCSKCYAHRSRYIIKNVKDSYHRRYERVLEALKDNGSHLDYVNWVEAMTYLINSYGSKYFRWFDSGDLLSVRHLEMIIDVVRATPDVMHWLPTLEYEVVYRYWCENGKLDQIPNLVIRMSTPVIDGYPVTNMAEKIGCKTSNVSAKKRESLKAFKDYVKQAEFITEAVEDGVAPEGLVEEILTGMNLIRTLSKSDNICPAKMQDNSCMECRACWDKTIPNITYIQH